VGLFPSTPGPVLKYQSNRRVLSALAFLPVNSMKYIESENAHGLQIKIVNRNTTDTRMLEPALIKRMKVSELWQGQNSDFMADPHFYSHFPFLCSLTTVLLYIFYEVRLWPSLRMILMNLKDPIRELLTYWCPSTQFSIFHTPSPGCTGCPPTVQKYEYITDNYQYTVLVITKGRPCYYSDSGVERPPKPPLQNNLIVRYCA